MRNGGGVPHTVAGLLASLRAGDLRPVEVAGEVLARITRHADPAVWVGGVDDERLVLAAQSVSADGRLAGVPFAVKDNIDVAGVPTTAGCPEYATTPAVGAPAVQRLLGAGALAVGKTNLDQFATGLVGTRSPYGTPCNVFDARLVPGGSSSGSGIAVAAGLVPFALGTDTAGSGRVPAALGNIVGCKPTVGLVSTRGVVPACRSIDCVSVFTLTAHDAALVLGVLDAHDPGDIYARPLSARAQRPAAAPADIVVGVPDDGVIALCDPAIADAFHRQVEELRVLGCRIVRVDLAPFLEAGDLLYGGPWLAERRAAVGGFIDAHPDAVLDVTRTIILGADRYSATDLFVAEYRRRALTLEVQRAFTVLDAIIVPTIPFVPTIAEVEADPIGVNARLGRFTTFVNLVDLCAVAVPGGTTADGVHCGFTLVAPACHDLFLLSLADRYQRAVDRPLGALAVHLDDDAQSSWSPTAASTIPVAVVGAHLAGQPLNDQLTSRGATLATRTTTSASYRFFALADMVPPKPGMLRTSDGGAPIEVEVWDVPSAEFGSFVAEVPAPLAIGKLELVDGRWVSGFVCEPGGLVGARDITEFGGWRAFLSARG